MHAQVDLGLADARECLQQRGVQIIRGKFLPVVVFGAFRRRRHGFDCRSF